LVRNDKKIELTLGSVAAHPSEFGTRSLPGKNGSAREKGGRRSAADELVKKTNKIG
jgi:hypothetical protein